MARTALEYLGEWVDGWVGAWVGGYDSLRVFLVFHLPSDNVQHLNRSCHTPTY